MVPQPVAPALGLTLLAAALLGLLLGGSPRTAFPSPAIAAAAIGYTAAGYFLLRQRGSTRLGRVTWAVGMLALLWLLGWAWSAHAWGAWLSQWAWLAPVVLLPVVVALFPDGQLPRQFASRATVLAGAAAGVVGVACLAVAAVQAPRTLVTDTAVPLPAVASRLVLAAGIALVGWLLAAVAIMVRLVRRVRASGGRARAQFLCLVPAAALLPAGIALDIAQVPGALVPAVVAFPVGVATAVVGYQWDDLDLAVDRRVVRAVVLSLTVAGAALAFLAVGPWAGRLPWPALAGVGALVLALGSALQRRLDAAVLAWLYGSRGDPAEVLRLVAAAVDKAGSGQAAMDATVRATAHALRLPYVGVVARVHDRDLVVAEFGRALLEPEAFEWREDTGIQVRLIASPRNTTERLTAAERWALTEVGRQAGLLARTHALALDLQAARDRIVRSREQERVRIRNDLHDGLGPTIFGLRLQLGAIDQHDLSPHSATIVSSISEALAEAAASLRHLVDGLRPSALDAGLTAAIEDLARSVLSVPVRLETPHQLGELPAAVETAAYRIAGEALANIAKHDKGAHAVRVVLKVVGAELLLTVEAEADGSPTRVGREGGIGLSSMRDRAEEIGGWCEIDPRATGWVVCAGLPIAPS